MTHNEEIAFIVVVGLTGSGKTTFVNHASGSNFEVGHGMSSCTKAVAATNTFAGPSDQRVVLIDTPGFDSSDTNKSDKQALRDIAINVGRIYGAEKKKRLAGVIYMHRISDPRLGRSTTDNVQRALRLVAKMSKRRVVIATTFWDKVDAYDANERERDLASRDCFGRTLTKGAAMLRFSGDAVSARTIISQILETGRETGEAQNFIDDWESEGSLWKCW